jgi:hypothetical protein
VFGFRPTPAILAFLAISPVLGSREAADMNAWRQSATFSASASNVDRPTLLDDRLSLDH